VYESHCASDELLFTISQPTGYYEPDVSFIDFIFHEYVTLRPIKIWYDQYYHRTISLVMI
jgi:hypothetical protein